jgi:hypothetical protein
MGFAQQMRLFVILKSLPMLPKPLLVSVLQSAVFPSVRLVLRIVLATPTIVHRKALAKRVVPPTFFPEAVPSTPHLVEAA